MPAFRLEIWSELDVLVKDVCKHRCCNKGIAIYVILASVASRHPS